ncbi:hypothetical protein vBSscSF1_117 [Staphylococcus phage vB-SscS-F1]|nr:hypothetical protein vBApySJF1_117 [Arcanobacterium phage vB-ApyS-JF1]
MFYNVNDLSEREKLENDINGFLKIFNKEYEHKSRKIETTAFRVLLKNVFDLIERIDQLDKKGNRWFKFKNKRKLQDVGYLLAMAEKWEMF